MARRLSKSGSGGGIVQLVNKGETSPVLLINPVFTITANNWAAACDQASTRRVFPKQKSKSSGASPQKYLGGGGAPNFADEFINIITSSDSIDYCADYEYGDDGRFAGHSSRSSGRSFHSNPFLSREYGSNSRLLQVPSASTLLLPCRGSHYYEDDLSPERNPQRQQRSSSITVPIGHMPRSPEKWVGQGGTMRRCSSASPKGRYNQALYGQGQNKLSPQQLTPTLHPFDAPRRNSATTTSTRRRRSSTYSARRRLSAQSGAWSSSSSVSDEDAAAEKKSPLRRTKAFVKERSFSIIPTSELLLSNTNMTTTTTHSSTVSEELSPCGGGEGSSGSGSGGVKKKAYDTVIIGSPAVGKSTLAEYFNSFRKGGSSGSDQGIGSDEDSTDSYDDQDLSAGGKAIVYRPHPLPQHNFSLRIFSQQTSAVNHLYKYDAVVILYSVTDRDSFEFARKALAEINSPSQGRKNKVVILVANKSDLERSRSVTPLEGRSLATAYNCKFIEISSSLGVGIEALQKGLATQVYLRHHKNHLNSTTTTTTFNVAIPEGKRVSPTSSTSSNSSTSFLTRTKFRSGKKNAALNSLKMAQKLIERIINLKFSPHQNSKSCLDLHTL